MGEIAIAPQKVIRGGMGATYTTDAILTLTDTFTVRNTGRMIMHFLKGAAVICNVLIDTPAKVGGIDVANITVAVPANTGNKVIGPFPPSIFNDGNGDLKFTMDDIDGVTVAALEI